MDSVQGQFGFLRDGAQRKTRLYPSDAGQMGQVLVVNDMLGLFEHTPYYVKRYANLFEVISKAGETFGQDVKSGSYPSEEFYDKVIKRRG